MQFKQLFADFIAGTPIKRKVWRGYWVYKYGKIEIHSKTGEVINFLDTQDILFTISGILQDDWEVATNENCDVSAGKGNSYNATLNVKNAEIDVKELKKMIAKAMEQIPKP
jgi:hypothetical protein